MYYHEKIKVLLVLQSGYYLIASTIDTLHNTINGFEIACMIWSLQSKVQPRATFGPRVQFNTGCP